MASSSTELLGYGIEPEDLEYLRRLRTRLNGPYAITYNERLAIAVSLDTVIDRISACPLRVGDVIEQPRLATDGSWARLKH